MQNQVYEQFINNTAKNISVYLAPFIVHLESFYTWGENIVNHPFVKENIDYDFSNLSSSYHMTLELKRQLQKLIKNADTLDEQYAIGEFFVTQWGGVTGHKDLKGVLAKFEGLNSPYDIKIWENVSSWSKYLSLLFEDAYIYDSRVAFAINTINYCSGTTDYFFPTPSGRSSRLGLIDIETLYVLDKLHKSKEFLNSSALKHKNSPSKVKEEFHIPKKHTYDVYLDLIKRIQIRMNLEKGEAFKIEMLLFCLAPQQILESLINYLKAK